MAEESEFAGADHIKEHVESWKDLSPSKMKPERLGGLSNELWKVTSLDKEVTPQTVIYRKFGPGAAICDRERENYVLRGLAKKKIAPKYYGGDTEYRVEKFIESKELTPDDIGDEKTRKEISKIVADLHNTDFEKLEKKALVKKIIHEDEDFIKSFKEKAKEDVFLPVEKKLLDKISKLVTQEEIKFLEGLMPKKQESIVFSHNDLHSQNFMVMKEDKKMVLIDYEYANYNYRGIDIANLFTETMFEYDTKEHPHYAVDESKFPDDKVLKEFIKYYLFYRKFGKEEYDSDKIFEKESNIDEYVKEKHDLKAFEKEVDEILQEVKVARLFSHYFWALWGILMSHREDAEFDYVHYGYKRYEFYQKIKKELTGKGQDDEDKDGKEEAEDTSNP